MIRKPKQLGSRTHAEHMIKLYDKMQIDEKCLRDSINVDDIILSKGYYSVADPVYAVELIFTLHEKKAVTDEELRKFFGIKEDGCEETEESDD